MTSLALILGCAGPVLSADEAAFFRAAQPWGGPADSRGRFLARPAGAGLSARRHSGRVSGSPTASMTSLALILGCAGPVLSADEAAFFRAAQPWGFILDADGRTGRFEGSVSSASGRCGTVGTAPQRQGFRKN
jgi:hypothetical protein